MGLDHAKLVNLARERGRWRDYVPRTYVEAFPQLNIVQCAKAAEKGRNLCLWERLGTVMGGAEFEWRSRDNLHLTYHHQPEEGISCSGSISLAIVYVGSMDHNHRALVHCPGCFRNRSSIVLMDSIWQCRSCQYLGYRSSLVGTAVRRAEKLARLEEELSVLLHGFFPRHRQEKKRAEVEKARQLAGRPPYPVAHERFAYQLEPRFTVGPLDDLYSSAIFDRLPGSS